MISNVLEIETKLLNALKNNDTGTLSRLVSAKALLYGGNEKLTKDDYVLAAQKYDSIDYEISGLETILATDKYVQINYTLLNVAKDKSSRFEGKFLVTSTWENISGEWKLIFQMDRKL